MLTLPRSLIGIDSVFFKPQSGDYRHRDDASEPKFKFNLSLSATLILLNALIISLADNYSFPSHQLIEFR